MVEAPSPSAHESPRSRIGERGLAHSWNWGSAHSESDEVGLLAAAHQQEDRVPRLGLVDRFDEIVDAVDRAALDFLDQVARPEPLAGCFY